MSLHAFDLIRAECSERVRKVSTVISISSGEMTELMFDGSSDDESCGGLGMPVVLGFFTAFACTPLRFRFAMVCSG
jgi:hypothetical protein